MALRYNFDYYKSTPGRRERALRQTKPLAEAIGDANIVEGIEKAIEANRRARMLEGEWRHSRNVDEMARKSAIKIDHELDRLLGVLHRRLRDLKIAFPDQEIGEQAATMLEKLFPDGAGELTTMTYDGELSATQFILDKLTGPWSGEVDEMDLGRLVNRLSTVADKFEEALNSSESRATTWDEVREADNEGYEAMLRVIAKIIGTFSDPDQAETRTKLLGPIDDQDARVGELHRRQRKVTDIDPETGEELPEGEQAEPPSDADEIEPTDETETEPVA